MSGNESIMDDSGVGTSGGESQVQAPSSDEGEGTTIAHDDPNYIVIYTPKVIVSDCDVPPAPVETLNFFYRRQDMSRTRFIEKVHAQGELKINSSAWESQIISAATSHSHVLPAGSRSKGFITQSHSQVIQLEIFRSRSHKLRFVTDQAGILPSLCPGGNKGTRKHMPPEKRIKLAQQLLQIRDLFVDVVVCLRSMGFGGEDFRWSPSSLEAYGITKPPPLRIPEAFKAFATPAVTLH